MRNQTNNSKQAEVGKREGLKKKVIPLLTLLLVLTITVALFLYRDRVAELGHYGYLGAFLISLIGNATVLLLPVAVLPVLLAISVAIYPVTGPVGPIIVGLAGGVGAGIGEISGYMLGYSGHGVVRNNKIYLRLVGWMRRWGILTVFVISLAPFFFDLAGMAAGILRFPLWKFILACWLGRTVNYVSSCLFVSVWGWEAALRYFG